MLYVMLQILLLIIEMYLLAYTICTYILFHLIPFYIYYEDIEKVSFDAFLTMDTGVY